MTTRPSIIFQPRPRGALFARLKQGAVSAPDVTADNLIILRDGAVECHGGQYYYVARVSRLNPVFDIEQDLS